MANLKVLLITAFCFGYLYADEVIVEIPDGKIKGQTVTTITKTTFYSFQGIPYAQPPINKLRFLAPVPVEPWDDILDATYEKNVCYQAMKTKTREDENEDCLFINVFTPEEPGSEAGLPVMVFFYGDGFMRGSSESVNYGPDHFMDYNVILITFNYRLGAFGFLSTGDDAIPGNAGLKDQNLALKWVNKNIAYFGGDPKKVTIFGAEAGSASVGYHILSPLSKGLFRAAIMESGSPLSPWAYQRDHEFITVATAFFVSLDFHNLSSTELLEGLQSVPVERIDTASTIVAFMQDIEHEQIQQGFAYAPVIEHEHEGAFITDRMFELIRKGKINMVPLLIGINSEESYYFTDGQYSLDYMVEYFDDTPSHLIPEDMRVGITGNNRHYAISDIKEFYIRNTTFTENPLSLIKYFSDQCFVRSIIKHAGLQSQYTDVYFYQFSYSGVLGGHVEESVEGFSDIVRHGEELSYIFRRNYEGLNNTDLSKFPEQDQTVFKRFITFFTNFAKTLNPTPESEELLENIIWPKVNITDFAYLDIGSSSEIKYHPREPNYHEWEAIYYKYGEPPYDTY